MSVVAAWPLRFPCILSHACRATLRHNSTCPLLSPVCHQLPQPSERAVSPAHLPSLRRSAALYRGSSQRQAAAPRPHRAWGTERGQSVSPPMASQVRRMACTACPGSCASKLEVPRHSPQAGMGLGQGSERQCWSSVSLNLPFIPYSWELGWSPAQARR